MIEEYLDYLEHIKTENEKHREAVRQDHLAYIENVKQALIDVLQLQQNDVQMQQNFDSLRINFAGAALNGILTRPYVDYTKKDEVSKHAWEYADKMIETMGELK